MNSASVLRLHTHTVSIRSDKAERLLFVLEKKKKVQIKNQEKKTTTTEKKKKRAGSTSLPSSSWVLLIPYCSSCVRRSPQEGLGEGWWVVYVGMEGRVEASREKRLVNKPDPSQFSQSPEPVLVEVSTEDGADISSEPMTNRRTFQCTCCHRSRETNACLTLRTKKLIYLFE